ncbi:MAG: ATP-binding cassette domain-containing protein [Mycolicibacterium rufum]|uniref:Lipoprotein-releasing system ATP-binding protein LolD n=1 Tax=Mycolicibacterium chlorophenolicum TaxID=37916 RepID=A0A0J6VMN2_9MYCO|nr:ATP-binding cassette domain-containing protein [Mycolicibacterium chlorophenolicum]KMO70782.1 Lipoprotein-releasing system ATP-binding protein LolD [Mycolicibacterium chlorophenolicum]MBI5340916.1 ATP-binding cassette domain-containing protein [Mycolicibacterium rufum]
MTSLGRTTIGVTSERGEDAVVRTERLTRCFGTGAGTVVAVRGVTVSVTSGDRIALTGPSGSGKSTLLHLLAGLVTPTSGSVCWPDADPDAAPVAAGLVFQGRSLVPNLNVTENVRLPLLFAGCREADATNRAHAALSRLGICALATAMPDTLSGGQAQRVGIARVLAAAPRLILADEPTGQLDHAAAALVIDVLLGAADDLGSALIVSTHDPVVARRLPMEWAMRDGRLRRTSLDGQRR